MSLHSSPALVAIAPVIAWIITAFVAAGEADPMATSPTQEAIEQIGDVRPLVPTALDGDISAAERIAAYYQLAGPDSRAEFWAQIAAENGSAPQMRILAVMLVAKTGSQVTCRRARFWYERAIQTTLDNVRRKRLVANRADFARRVSECLKIQR